VDAAQAEGNHAMTDWMPELTDEDLAVLMEAVEAWESKDFAGEMMGDLVGAMMTRNDPEGKAKYDEQRGKEKAERERVRTARKEAGVMLRAKLLTLRNRRRTKALGQVATSS
jgi:hypothetical protein